MEVFYDGSQRQAPFPWLVCGARWFDFPRLAANEPPPPRARVAQGPSARELGAGRAQGPSIAELAVAYAATVATGDDAPHPDEALAPVAAAAGVSTGDVDGAAGPEDDVGIPLEGEGSGTLAGSTLGDCPYCEARLGYPNRKPRCECVRFGSWVGQCPTCGVAAESRRAVVRQRADSGIRHFFAHGEY